MFRVVTFVLLRDGGVLCIAFGIVEDKYDHFGRRFDHGSHH